MLSPFVFFQSILRSIYDRTIYKDFLQKSWGFSLGWLYAVLTLISLLWIAPLAFSIAGFTPRAHEFLQTAMEDLRMWYPDELEIQIKDGVLRTNVSEPYVLDFPQRWKPMQHETFPFDHLLTINTNAHIEDLSASRSFALITSHAVAVHDENPTQVRVFMFSNIHDFLMNKTLVNGAVDSALPYLQYVRPLMVWGLFGLLLVFPFLAAGIRLVWVLGIVFMTSVLLFVIAKAMQRPLEYPLLYRLSLHGITGSLFWKLLESWFHFHFPLVALALFIGWMVCILRSLPQKKIA